MKPHVIIVGADKGGVGKTTITRALLDYYEINGKGSITRAFDTQQPKGNLKDFFPEKTTLVDITKSDGQMKVFDTLRTTPVTVIDLGAGLLSPTLQMLNELGFIESIKEDKIAISVLHVLGGTTASFDEIKETSVALTGANHYLVRNHINENSFFDWNPDITKVAEGVGSGVIDIPKLNERASEYVDGAKQSFLEFTKKTDSDVMRGYVRFWLARVCQEFDRKGLNTL